MSHSGKMELERKVYTLAALNPYQGNWIIKVRVTNKGYLRTYKNANGEGQVFKIEITDKDETKIQATMFNIAAKKFYDVFELGKVYYISKGTVKAANKQFNTVNNEYEMILNENSIIEKVIGEEICIPETKFNFVPIDQLSSYVNGRDLIDVIGIVQHVSPTLTIRRKRDNEMIPKRDIIIIDESKKTVVVSLWNDQATNLGQQLLDVVDKAPIVALKSVKVGDFQGVTLSLLGKSTMTINPEFPKANELRSWYNSEGKEVIYNISQNGAKFMFVPIDELSSYVNGRDLIDVIGVVQHVSPTLRIRRKRDNEMITKRDITIIDESKKTVVVSLWNDHATNLGQQLLDVVDKAPIVAIKSVKVGEFQGVTLSLLGKSTMMINPEISKAKELRSWYNSEGKELKTSISQIGAKFMYSNRVFVSHIRNNPSLGNEKPEDFCLKAYVSYIKPDQTMWYQACKQCNKKVKETLQSSYWCEGCKKSSDESNLRYIITVKVSDPTGEAWVSIFNEHAKDIIGYSAEELNKIRKDGNEDLYILKIKEAEWTPYLLRVSVTKNEFNNGKQQRMTVRSAIPIDFVAESRFLLEEISKMQTI